MGFSLATQRMKRGKQLATRQHLLEAAGQVFADAGYRAATVREICERAGANIAAVNYHFGDKEQLYPGGAARETLPDGDQEIPGGLRAAGERDGRGAVEGICAFAVAADFFGGAFGAAREVDGAGDDGADGRDGRCIVREDIRPMSALLVSIVSELLGAGADEATKRLCANSVVSQALFYHHCRPVVVRLHPDLKFDRAGIERLTEHITRFSLAAIKNLAVKPRNGRASKK